MPTSTHKGHLALSGHRLAAIVPCPPQLQLQGFALSHGSQLPALGAPLSLGAVSPGVQVMLTAVLERRSPPALALRYPVALHLAASTKPGAGPKIEI